MLTIWDVSSRFPFPVTRLLCVAMPLLPLTDFYHSGTISQINLSLSKFTLVIVFYHSNGKIMDTAGFSFTSEGWM